MRLTNFIMIWVILISNGQFVNTARILGVFAAAGKSLNILYNKLMRSLADVGHDVTVISAYKNKFPIVNGSYTDVLLTGFAEDYEDLVNKSHLLDGREYYPLWSIYEYYSLFFDIWNKTFKHPNIHKMLNSSMKFDLILSEYYWNDCLEMFAHIYGCPVVLFMSMGGVNSWINQRVGNYLPTSSVRHFFMLGDFAQGMNFFQRIHNFLYYIFDYFITNLVVFPGNNAIIEEVYHNLPHVSSLRQSIPLAPNMVEIGGFHIDPPKKLSNDLQEILDNARNGAIFFSMGSHLKSRDFSEEKRRMFLNIFKKLDQIVLWKFEDDDLPEKPDNVYIKKWFAQMDLLAHTNIRLFMTHGGYGSLQEAVYHGVPVLTIPVFADQFNNAHLAVQLGYALKLSYNDENFHEDTLYRLIQEMIKNPQYRENAKMRSRLFHDRPMKPLETAIYWIEYVIRNKGAPDLKLAALQLPFYQLYNLDIYLFFIVSIAIVYKTIINLVWYLANNTNNFHSKIKNQ